MKRWICASIVVTALVGGCANQVSGGATPVGPQPGVSAPASPWGGAGDGIDLVRFDPCASITNGQAKSLGLDGPKPKASADGVKSCSWTHFLSEPIESYLVDGSDRQGIESIAASGAPFTIKRFAAVEASNRYGGADKACAIAIAVRPGQVLLVAYIYSGATQRMSHDLACQKAKPVAEMVIANLDRGGN